MHAGGLEFGFFRAFLFSFSQFLLFTSLMLHDKMGQNFSLGKHILSFCLFYDKKENGNFCSPWLYCIRVSKLSLRKLSFWTKQIKGTIKSGLKLEPESICWY